MFHLFSQAIYVLSFSFKSAAASSLSLIYLPRPEALWLQVPALGPWGSHHSIHLKSMSAGFPSDLLWHLKTYFQNRCFQIHFSHSPTPCLTQVFTVAWFNSLWVVGYPRVICYYWKRPLCERTLIPCQHSQWSLKKKKSLHYKSQVSM